MKEFQARIQENQLERAIDLKGWSHCGPSLRVKVLWYPWEADFRIIYFTAKNRTAACKELDRLGILARDLTDGQ